MQQLKPLSRAALAMAFLATPVFAHHAGDTFNAGDITVSHSWTQVTSATSHSIEVFLTVNNDGEEADRLVGATTSFTDDAVFQAPVVGSDGALQVTEVPAIEIAPGQSLTLQPGGIHIVLPNVQREFSGGDHFHVTLEFEVAGALEIDVDVEGQQEHDHEHDYDDHGHDHDHEPDA